MVKTSRFFPMYADSNSWWHHQFIGLFLALFQLASFALSLQTLNHTSQPPWERIRHRNVPWVWGPMLKAVWSPAGLSFLTGSFVDRISVWPGNWREATLVTTGFHVWFLQTILFCWHHQARTFSMHWSGLQLQWELAPPSLRPWFSSRRKGGLPPLGWWGRPDSSEGI